MKQNEIAVFYGGRPREMVGPLLDYLDILDDIPRDRPIGLKPNLVVAKPSATGATTDPAIVYEVLSFLFAHGFDNITLLESSWIGERTSNAFRICGYYDLLKDFHFKIVDLKLDSSIRVEVDGLSMDICKQATQLGYLINLPVLKAHCQTKMTCSLKNLKGMIPDAEKRRFHSIGLSKPIAYLNKIISTNITLVDGIIGDLTFEEGGTPVRMDRIIAGRDPVLIDAYAATLLGYSPYDIDYIRIAEKIGVGSADLQSANIYELNMAAESEVDTTAIQAQHDLLRQVSEDQACSACLGSLVHALHRLSEGRKGYDSKRRLFIGQGFIGKKGPGIGIGDCASGFDYSVEGCPPTAQQIRDLLLQL